VVFYCYSSSSYGTLDCTSKYANKPATAKAATIGTASIIGVLRKAPKIPVKKVVGSRVTAESSNEEEDDEVLAATGTNESIETVGNTISAVGFSVECKRAVLCGWIVVHAVMQGSMMASQSTNSSRQKVMLEFIIVGYISS
jgi:hypothetical protein